MQRNSIERAEMLAERRQEQRSRVARITPIARKTRLSKRGERAQTWRTKAWTPARFRDLIEATADNLWANDALAALDAAHWNATRDRLLAHLNQHPNDNCAEVALQRLAA